jgi:hypothetical protein
MKWRELTLTKKFLIIGVVVGVLVGTHFNFTDCRTSAGGPVGECESEWEFSVAIIEYKIFMISFMVTLGWILFWPLDIILKFFGVGIYSVNIVLSFILFFGLTGLILGFISEKLKRLYDKILRNKRGQNSF